MAGLRQVRQQQAMSRRALAAKAGVTPAIIYAIETGRRPRLHEMQQICAALGVNPEEIEEFRPLLVTDHQGAQRPDPQLLTVRQVAERIQVSTETVRGWLRRGKLVGVRAPDTHQWLIPESALEALIQGERPQ